jgi:hypothetical protein
VRHLDDPKRFSRRRAVDFVTLTGWFIDDARRCNRAGSLLRRLA